MEYTTSEGRVVPLRRVAPRYIDQIRAKHTIPDPPTYSFKAAGGVVVTKEHDEESVEESPAEDKAAWLDYVTERRTAYQAQEQEVLEFLMYQCIAEDPPPVDEWSVDFELFKLEKPDDKDPIKFKVDWVQYELITDQEKDYAGLMTRLYEMGGMVDSSHVAKFEGLFQLVVERLAAAGLGGVAE